MIFNGSFKTHEVLKDTRFPVSGKSPDTRLHNHCPVPLFKIQCATEQKNRRIVMTYQIDTFLGIHQMLKKSLEDNCAPKLSKNPN